MKILSKEEVEKVANTFDFDGELIFNKVIDFEPDCKIYELKNETDDKYILICRDYQFDDKEAEERILNDELRITILDRIKSGNDDFFRTKEFDKFKYIFSLIRIA